MEQQLTNNTQKKKQRPKGQKPKGAQLQKTQGNQPQNHQTQKTECQKLDHVKPAKATTVTRPKTGSVATELRQMEKNGPVRGSDGRYVPTSSCTKTPFTTIMNNGRDGVYDQSCMWISLSNAIALAQTALVDTDERRSLSTVELRNMFGFPNASIQFELNYDPFEPTIGHNAYLQAVCDQFNITVYVYTANYTGDVGSVWIGNPAIHVGDSNRTVSDHRKFAIVDFGGHYELIVSKTPTTPRHNVNKKIHKTFKMRSYRYVPPQSFERTQGGPAQLPPMSYSQTVSSVKKTDTPSSSTSLRPTPTPTSTHQPEYQSYEYQSYDRQKYIAALHTERARAIDTIRAIEDERAVTIALNQCIAISSPNGVSPLNAILFKKNTGVENALTQSLVELNEYVRCIEQQLQEI